MKTVLYDDDRLNEQMRKPPMPVICSLAFPDGLIIAFDVFMASVTSVNEVSGHGCKEITLITKSPMTIIQEKQ